ncbi:amino acid ABC transporter permease [Phascolarctobacterium succinatutens]|jgi:His/Glu/Gln/Arg/opine family amino acid ABC transporter permease subunit|uniref:amino acid ABC transporter permease n=1 Tax=Phascolarctobacterium succinatutens TaxID=626940 RepID=UPI003FD77B07
MLDFSVLEPYVPLLATAVWITLKFTFFSTIMGFFGGFILALITLSKNRVLSFLAKVYISVFRGTPLLVQLMLIYFATPQLTSYTISALEAGVLSFGLNSAAYISEALRGGILAVDKGQWEGAMSLGVPKHRFLLDIILPQAIKNALPSLVNESIMLLKDSSLVSVIGVADTLRWADLIQAKTFRAFEAFIVAAAVYYVLVMALNFLGGLLEKKVRVSD